MNSFLRAAVKNTGGQRRVRVDRRPLVEGRGLYLQEEGEGGRGNESLWGEGGVGCKEEVQRLFQ